jgi:4-amino-4-deoxy-L-arabinose transferase-like glycosyltransferase
MSATTDSGRRGLALMERLLDSLTDPARRERSVAAALLCYVVVWTLYGMLAKASQDIHVDMSEQFALARELALGYPKHPPLTMAVVRGWFAVFPTADWAYYLLAMANVGLTLWIVWRLMARFVDGEKRVVGLALLTLVPFFNFHALKFNVNTVLMPLWAATTLWFLRSFETRRPLDAALAGLAAAASMYGKYWSVFLLVGLGLAALADPRRAAYFRSAAPWVTVAVGSLALAPHAAWLVANDFAPFSYAVVVHGASSLVSTLGAVGGYLAGSVGYVAIPLIIVAFAARPVGATVRDMAWPAQPQRRLAALAFWAVLLTPALVAPFTGVRLTSLWTMSAWTLLPVMLLSSPLVMISRRDALGILTLAAAFPVAVVVAAPAIGFAIHSSEPPPGTAQSSLLAEPVERVWRETTNQPLRLFGGYEEFTDAVPFYMPSQPFAVHVLDGVAVSQALEARIGRDGIALVCPTRSPERLTTGLCIDRAVTRARCSLPGMQVEVEVFRRHLGVGGKRARYLIITIPPMQADRLPPLRDLATGYPARPFKME